MLVAVSFVLTTKTTQAQAWEKKSVVLGIGLGVSSFYHIDPDYNAYHGFGGSRGRGFAYAPLTGQFNLQMEFGVHQYVGLGFCTGVGGRAGYYYSDGELNAPISFIGNFHFYQLIADKTGKNIHADKLDIYGGFSLGTGIAIQFDNNRNNRIVPLIYGGPHLGVRYYFTPKFGINGEVGFGKSLINGGLVFKL